MRNAALLLAVAVTVVIAAALLRRALPVAPSVRRPNVSRWNYGAERRGNYTRYAWPEPEDGVQADDYPWRVLARGGA